MGKAIGEEAGFPKNGTPREKARYVASRLPEIARSYQLSAGTGSVISSAVVGIVRKADDFARLLWGGGDKENAAPLKSSGTGNCGEWSYAFSEILDGAGVDNQVVFGDDNPEPGASSKFTGTDTAVLVQERDPSGRLTSRIFDPFRSAYHNTETRRPSEKTAAEWNDLPLSDRDKTDADKKSGRETWKDDLIGKKHVKDAGNELVIDFGEGKADTKEKGFILGKVVHEGDGSPATEVTIMIRKEGFENSLAPQGNGNFTAAVPPGAYQVVVLLPDGKEAASATPTIEVGEKEKLELTVPKTEEEQPSYLGHWNGTAKVIRSSVSGTVGTVGPFDMDVVLGPEGLEFSSQGQTKIPAGSKTQIDGNHIRLDFAGKPPWMPDNEAFATTITWWMDVTADSNRMTGQMFSNAKTVSTLPGVPPAEAEFLISLDLRRQK